MSITLYLDFDGVLHHDEAYRDSKRGIYLKGGGTLFEHALALELALQPFLTSLDIVISSSWVREVGFKAARERLLYSLQERVVGSTYHRRHNAELWDLQTRYAQIRAHATRHMLTRWLAIDDDTEGWPAEHRHRLVSPQSAVGLQPGDIAMVVKRLTVLGAAR